jgi:hypothetical protein
MIRSSRSLTIGLGVVLFAAGSASAADIPKPPEVSRVKNDVYRMRSGTTRVKDPENKDQWPKNLAAIKAVTQWLAFSIVQPPYNGELVPREDKDKVPPGNSMSTLMVDAESFTKLDVSAGNQGKVAPEQLEYAAEFGKAMAESLKIVIDNASRPIERINAVRMMAITAKLPADALVEPLLAIAANDKISDAEKFYAFQGLKNLLEQTEVLDSTRHFPDLARDIVRLGRIAQTLTNYVMQKRIPRDDRERMVIEYVRREAVAALARFKEGVLRKPNKDLVFRPSWSLVRVFASDPSVAPAFSIQEQIEAAIGFCQMKVDPDMNLDVAAYTVAGSNVPGAIVNFVRAANLDSERAGRDGTLPVLPWKLAAARLSYALAVWREAVKPLPKTRYPETVVTLATESIIVLAPFEKEGAAARTDVAAIARWATNNPPKAWTEEPPKPAQLYKDDPNSLLPFASAPAMKTPDPKAVDAKKGPDPKVVDPKVDPKKGPTTKKPG